MDSNNDISAMISKIIQNPEFAEMVNEIRGSDADIESTKNEMMANLPGVLEMFSPLLGGKEEIGEKDSTEEKRGDKSDYKKDEAKEASALPHKYDKGKAEKLMNALKPYLNSERCLIIDRCMSVLQLTDVVGAFGGIDKLLGK